MKSGFYSIPLTGLKEGSHVYDLEIDNNFFGSFDKSEIKEGKLKATVTLLKCSAHMEMKIKISGSVRIVCDRCLEYYLQPLETEDHILIRHGDQWEEVDDELITIPPGESELDISQLIYEFIHLGLPIQKAHATDDNGESGCNAEMLRRLVKQTKEKTKDIDPRWKDLEKLKNNIN